jgi:hypothetical protein
MWCRSERSVGVGQSLVFMASEVIAPPSLMAWQTCAL